MPNLPKRCEGTLFIADKVNAKRRRQPCQAPATTTRKHRHAKDLLGELIHYCESCAEVFDDTTAELIGESLS